MHMRFNMLLLPYTNPFTIELIEKKIKEITKKTWELITSLEELGENKKTLRSCCNIIRKILSNSFEWWDFCHIKYLGQLNQSSEDFCIQIQGNFPGNDGIISYNKKFKITKQLYFYCISRFDEKKESEKENIQELSRVFSIFEAGFTLYYLDSSYQDMKSENQLMLGLTTKEQELFLRLRHSISELSLYKRKYQKITKKSDHDDIADQKEIGETTNNIIKKIQNELEFTKENHFLEIKEIEMSPQMNMF